MRKITDSEPRTIREVNSAIPDWLAQIVAKLLRKSAAERFQSAAQVADLLRDCLAHVQQPTTVALPRECQPGNRTIRRSRASWVAISLATAAVAGLLFFVIANLRLLSRGPEQATSSHKPAAIESDDAFSNWKATSDEFRSFDDDLTAFETDVELQWRQLDSPEAR